MSEDERRYTLTEARLELTRQECALRGHDFDVVTLALTGSPVLVTCGRCGQEWQIADG